MLASSLGTLLLGTLFLGALLGTDVAAAAPSTCLFAPLLAHRVDAGLEQKDALAPGTPVVVAVDAFRRAGMTCTRASCVSNSCGDTGTVRIDLAPSAEDNTPPSELGYRLEVVRGALPASMLGAINVPLAAGQTLFLRASFEEMTNVDASLVAVAVDGAGNESEPTEPFAVQFDGCTLAAIGDRCEDELDPDTDLGRIWSGEADEPLPDDASSVDAGLSCSFAGVARSPSRPGLGALSLGLLLLARARRRSAIHR
jgi:hypothetical protein